MKAPERWLAIGLVAAAAVVLAPYAPWVILAAWFAVFARRFHRPLAAALGDRPRLAAWITLAVTSLLLIPVGILLATVVVEAIDLVTKLTSSDQGRVVLEKLAGEGHRGNAEPIDALMGQSGRIWSIFQTVAGIATRIVIGLLILLTGVYTMLVDGQRWYAWGVRHAPFDPRTVRRMAEAFVETGRGLFIGIGGAGLIQSIVATAAYLYLGVPQPFALGFLTLLFSVVPAVGTAVVWVPVAAGLALTGRTTEAIGLAIFGAVVIGSVDNLVRPYLARRGQLQLPTYLVLVSMFGGVGLFGGWGILLGPLAVRLAREALVIAREDDHPSGEPHA